MESKAISSLKQSASRSLGNQRSSILIIALWSLCMLATFAVILGYQIRQKLTVIERLEDRDSLRYISEAGIRKAIVELKREPVRTYVALKDNWSSNENVFRSISIGGARVDICYEYYNEQTSAFESWYGLVDEERKININQAERGVLERLLRIVLGADEVMAQDLAASIIDWRDTDSELTLPSNNAEDSYYMALMYPYEVKNSGFEVLEELLLVKGMTQVAFEKIKNYITVYGDGKVNINTAPRAVLLALGLSEETVSRIISYRCGEDGVMGTSDDKVFESSYDIVSTLKQVYEFSETEIQQFSSICYQYCDTKSNNFTIRTQVQLNNRKNTTSSICVVDRHGKILRWQES